VNVVLLWITGTGLGAAMDTICGYGNESQDRTLELKPGLSSHSTTRDCHIFLFFSVSIISSFGILL
jgi:hypothetical protein